MAAAAASEAQLRLEQVLASITTKRDAAKQLLADCNAAFAEERCATPTLYRTCSATPCCDASLFPLRTLNSSSIHSPTVLWLSCELGGAV